MTAPPRSSPRAVGVAGEGGGVDLLEPPPREFEPPRPTDGGSPPRRGGRGGGGGGGGGGDGEPLRQPDPLPGGHKAFGFALMLISIGTLFLAFLGVWLLLRRSSATWPPPGTPRPPDGLWISTLLLAATSAALARASALRRRGRLLPMRRWLWRSTGLGLTFLGVQVFLWRGLVTEGFSISTNAYGMVFYTLTGLHALHVLGGLVYLAAVWLRAGGVGDARSGWTPVEFCAVYWHFMGVIWIALFAVLYFSG